jgi:hypothetical protein
METTLLSKAFKYIGHPESKGAIFHGAVLADEDGLYLLHNKHTWESAATAQAALGLIGLLFHWLATRNKKPGYPFPCIDYGQLDSEKKVSLSVKTAKDDSKLSIIPKSEIDEFTTGMLKSTKFKIGSIEIQLIGAKGKALKQIQEKGYEKA